MARTAGGVLQSRGWVAPKKVVRKVRMVPELEALTLSTKAKKGDAKVEEKEWRRWRDEGGEEEVEVKDTSTEEEEVEDEVVEKRQSSRCPKPVDKFTFGKNHLLKSVKQSIYASKIREKLKNRESQAKYDTKLKMAKLSQKVKDQKMVMVGQSKALKKKDKAIKLKDNLIDKLKRK